MHGGTFGTGLLLVLAVFATVPSGVITAAPDSSRLPRVLAAHAPIFIDGDLALSTSTAVTRGTGTPGDPYVIEAWEIDAANQDGLALRHTTRSVRIQNLTFRGSADRSLYSGVRLFQTRNVEIENLSFLTGGCVWGVGIESSDNVSVGKSTLLGCYVGIWIASSTRVAATGNVIRANGSVTFHSLFVVNTDRISLRANRVALDLPYSGDDEIRLQNVTNVTIIDNVIGTDAWRPNAAGLWMVDVLNATIRNNTFHSRAISASPVSGTGSSVTFRRGREIFDSYTITADNTIDGRPILFRNRCSNLTFDRLTVGELIIANCAGVRISNTTFRDVQVGLLIAYSTQVVVTYDRFIDVLSGLIMFESSGTVYHNDFINIGSFPQIQGSFGSVSLDSRYPTGGNYWAPGAPGGTDRCSGRLQDICPDADGIRDQNESWPLPYSYWVDHYPLMSPINATNTWPQAILRVDPPGGDSFTSFVFNASAVSDREDSRDLLQVRWDFGGDGKWDTNWTTDKFAAYRFPDVGSYLVYLEVRDSGGLLSIAWTQVQVPWASGWNALAIFVGIPSIVLVAILVAFLAVWKLRRRREPRGMTPPPSKQGEEPPRDAPEGKSPPS